MSNKNFNLPEGTTELTIREGQAPPVQTYTERPIRIEGVITAPADFYRGKENNGYLFDQNAVHIVYSLQERRIQLETEDGFGDCGAFITGRLTENPALAAVLINTGKRRTPKEMAQFLKMSRTLFTDRASNMQVVKSLNDLRVRVDRVIQQTDDNRGNRTASFEQELTTDIAMTFKLRAALFLGAEPSTFEVEILLDATDGGVMLWLESPEMKELQDVEAGALMAEQLERLKPLTTVQIG